MYRIAIVGGFGLENFGDDWLLSEAITLLSGVWKPQELVIVAPNSNFPGDQFEGIDVVQDVNNCFAPSRIFAGGTQFYFYDNETAEAIRNTFKNPIKNNTFPALLYRLLNLLRRDFYWNIGLGPFENETGQRYLEKKRASLDRATFVSLRDELSLEHFNKGLLGADIAWTSKEIKSSKLETPAFDVTLILRSWHDGQNPFSQNAARNLIAFLQGENLKVAVVLLSPLRDHFELEGVEVFTWKMSNGQFSSSCKALVTFLKKSHCLISARYHGIILGALAGIPRIAAFDIDPKLSALANDLEIPVFSNYLQTPDIKEFVLSSAPTLKKKKVTALKLRAQSSFEQLKSQL